MNLALQKMRCMNGSTLKIIAMVTMLIDHVAAFFLLYWVNTFQGQQAFGSAELIYQVMRQIGRTAFPIFCFLLVEGFFYTKNRWLYLIRLVLFAFISEIPFDLAATGEFYSIRYQNVFFTLALGMAMMMLLDIFMRKFRGLNGENGNIYIKSMGYILISFIVLYFAIYAAEFIRCDYGGKGILLIAIFYYCRNDRILACIIGYLSFMWEPFCFPAFLLMLFYNGKRGLSKQYFKYLFYGFYPIHILILYLLRVMVFQ